MISISDTENSDIEGVGDTGFTIMFTKIGDNVGIKRHESIKSSFIRLPLSLSITLQSY